LEYVGNLINKTGDLPQQEYAVPSRVIANIHVPESNEFFLAALKSIEISYGSPFLIDALEQKAEALL
jgi:hypothetical protein